MQVHTIPEPAARPEPLTPTPTAPRQNGASGPSLFAEESGASFWDFLDIINPLQHIPIVNTIYRHLTGDAIGALPRLVGGAVFGGPVGLGMAAANLVVQSETGRDVGEHVLALFEDEASPHGAPPRAFAANDLNTETPSPPPATAAAVAAPAASLDSAPAAPVRLAEARFFPVPERGGAMPARVMPVPQRAAPGPQAAAPDAAAVQGAMAAQGLAAGDHPLLQAAERGQDGDWFASRMLDAMDKYRRAATPSAH